MLLMVIISYEALISLTLAASLNISVNCATYILFIFQFLDQFPSYIVELLNFISGSASIKGRFFLWLY